MSLKTHNDAASSIMLRLTIHFHRRTGRAGKPGLVTSLITKHDAAIAREFAHAKKCRVPVAALQASASFNRTKRGILPLYKKTATTTVCRNDMIDPRHKRKDMKRTSLGHIEPVHRKEHRPTSIMSRQKMKMATMMARTGTKKLKQHKRRQRPR